MSFDQVLSAKQKALEINLNPHIYGTFAEIGAGQETVRFFYRAGGASGTLAKAMSAYDKDFSDAIYGKEEDGRYVTEERLKKMLDHEMSLIEQRLNHETHKDKLFFTYANTVTTIDFTKTYKGHGWVGIRFRNDPNQKEYNEIIFHVRFKETSAQLQQETLGMMGVNLIYGAYFYNDNPRRLLRSLYDGLDNDQVEIDMVNFSGPRFAYVDNRLMSLQLVKNGMTDAVIFGPNGKNFLPAAVLYKKNIFAMRGSFRPVTLVNVDMLESSLETFMAQEDVNEEDTEILFEITLSNLSSDGEIDERDFLDRADIIGSLGYNVIISNFSEYYKLVHYFTEFTRNSTKIGLGMGVNNLLEVFNPNYYENLPGGIMEAFGKLFKKNVVVYLYPYFNKEDNVLLNAENLKVNENLKELYKFFKFNQRIRDIENYNPAYLDIYSRKILEQIGKGEEGWEGNVPTGVAEMIKDRGMFGHSTTYALN
ncbi:TonB-dependent receptor [Moheibacter sp.]|uniref:TonB-dependent receptor n=1 Tax=Moheibacter sp. TaxID=1965316 RepID=UPI003C74E949